MIGTNPAFNETAHPLSLVAPMQTKLSFSKNSKNRLINIQNSEKS
jgi:hypothetical protein